MKRIILVLLAIVVLIPAFAGVKTVASAAETADTTGTADITPFTMINWDPVGNTYDNIFSLPKFLVYRAELQETGEWEMDWNGVRDVKLQAQKVKAYFENIPEGSRLIQVATYSSFLVLSEHVIYSDAAVEKLRNWLDSFLAEYKAIGGELDGIPIDNEYNHPYSYRLYSEQYKNGNIEIYQQIQDHPLYAKEIRPLLEARGFIFYESEKDDKPELYSICDDSGSKYNKSRSVWNAVMEERNAYYLNKAIYEPLMKYYPDALMGDYDKVNRYAWLKTPSDNGGTTSAGGNTWEVGNTSNMYTYAHRPTSNFFSGNGSYPVGYNRAIFEDNAFDALLWDMHVFKDAQAGLDEDGNFNAWVTYYDYRIGKAGHGKHTVSGTPYHTETLYHIGLMNPKPFLGYLIPSEIAGETGTKSGSAEAKAEYDKRLKNISDILNELTHVVGASDRKPILYPNSWNSEFVLSGMYAGGRNVWRLSLDTTRGITLEQYQVAGTQDPTFYIAGQTVTFPGGKILEETKIEPYGSSGYWVETATDVMPVITNDIDRYSKYPAYHESYDNYQEGMKYAMETALPVNAWEINMKTKLGGKATIVADESNPGNQMVELMGTGVLRNAIIPKRITAGDSYAKQQTWEVTMTLPDTMAAESQLILLQCADDDGGFKVEGGKLWYGEGAEYKAFENLDLSSGGKYTVKRVVDFRDAEAFTSSYYVYGVDGNEVAKVENVPMVNFTLPVQKITLSCSKITDKPVLLDDYKLYAAGIATDFEVYGAALGFKVEDPEQASNEDLAYRLSWMNATAENKTYNVIAARYDSENKQVSQEIVKTIYMAPNSDGVDTGIVDVAEGGGLRLYLQEQQKSGTLNFGRLVLFACIPPAFLMVGSVVAYLLVRRQRKKMQ